MGLFDSMDFTTWTWPEWLAIALGGYVLFSVVSTTKRGARVVRKKLRRRNPGKRMRAARRKVSHMMRQFGHPRIKKARRGTAQTAYRLASLQRRRS